MNISLMEEVNRLKLYIHCLECMQDGVMDGKMCALRDDNIYRWLCDRGHQVFQTLLNEKFELLFESGVYAMEDGYAREAVSSFAASLERFHEFCIEVFLQKAAIPTEELMRTWKYVARYSERQLGSFLFLYLSFFKNTPPWKVIEDKVAFRNKVIHQGYIPSSSETLEYARAIYDYVEGITEQLSGPLGDEVQLVLRRHQEALRERAGEECKASRHQQTILQMSSPLVKQKLSFEDALSNFYKRKEYYRLG